MGKPRMIILIRHAQSEGNKNREIHQTVPDHRVKLTPEGHRQAREAGCKLRGLLRPDDTIHFFTSPYRRTRETTEGILESLTSDIPSPSPFPRNTIKVYEEPRLREQDFGNFQPCSAEMERMWLERADYGHFFYRIPNGESAADAYDRVSGFNESLWRLFGEKECASVCVLVTHGLMTRVFLMKWYHWSVEYFEDLRNINHCEFVIMKLNPDSGKYALQNKLRTWSELKKENELERQRERAAKGLNPATTHIAKSVSRTWGGCPDGCNHGLHRKFSEPGLEAVVAAEPLLGDRPSNLRLSDIRTGPSDESGVSAGQPSIVSTHYDPGTTSVTETPGGYPRPAAASPSPNLNPAPRRPDLAKLHRDSEDHLLHPPRSNYALFHLSGHDGGGSMSGANSMAPSEDERDYPGSYGDRLDQHRPKPSQDFAHDGDDEDNGKQAQRTKHTRFQKLPSRVNRNGSKKGATFTSGPDRAVAVASASFAQNEAHTCAYGHEHEHEHEHDGDNDDDDDGDDDEDDDGNGQAALEAERQLDQSIRGSVY
ncbi:acid phosphatase DET1 [Aspergillus clavatus NRRL 1]|uniref:Phosphoglycerate mutase family domain protein n=1 Tax=Aspergillus clavatus (strain ATCC 1007 / CBS 513.65 / DSM 816 / NCTC 3887 / NRRL 1 / QM 1276 / 107) TaxID=344612 RepID=A1CKA5_ASPCL|nr:phosphoglycerate mutase family domain protein [Aspergillus clavatus NRRL 1]EAW09579.1 phosphoglycerate mutase family domain protein [Aspergillus clavatus NRRL 1]